MDHMFIDDGNVSDKNQTEIKQNLLEYPNGDQSISENQNEIILFENENT